MSTLLPCCGYELSDDKSVLGPVFWNPYNKLVQCHNCGTVYMPAKTPKQQKFMGAELGRKRAGEKTETGMSEEQLKDFARKTKYAKAGKARKPK